MASLNLILLVVLSSLSCLYWASARDDTLKPGDSLNSLSYLDSANGKFSLGFYVKFDNSYQLGIWWLGRSDLLWIVPNRCTPSVHQTSSTEGLLLTLDQNKTLKIIQKGGEYLLVLASADPQTTSSNASVIVATLLNSGNFVLQEVNSDDGSTKRVFWQSFDCPTNTLLPGMKLGIDKRNGHTWSLSSKDWSLDWDPKGHRLNISRAGVVYWSSGVFTDGRFEFISPNDVFGVPMFHFCVVSNSTQDYFTFYTHVNRSEISPWLLNKNGRLSAHGGHDIARADHCYGNNTDQGCQLFGTSTTLQEEGPSADAKKQRIRIGASIAATLLGVLFCILCYLRRRGIKLLLSGENNTKIEKQLLDLMATDNVNGLQNDVKMRHHLRVYSYESVMTATGNFSKENKLGVGGFGPVYKGKLMSGQEIAVKRLSRYSGQGTLEFKNEVKLISELQHTNLVQLLGFCIYGEERVLIYEYMANRSLDYFLFGWELDYDHLNMNSTRGQQLGWKKRLDIIGGIAQGLLYLHKYSRLRVIHRDVKASNILLDENMNPKISDFGLARIFTDNERQANTNRVVGTYGYMSPEYAMEGLFSTKSDVYSFGVLMLEIISGRKNNSFYNDEGVLNIVGYAWELWKEGAGLELMDPILSDSCIKDQLLTCIHVGLLCVEENAADRPTMSDVISILSNESVPLALPTKPAFFTARKVVGEEPEIISINGVSNSEFDGR